MIVNHVCFPTLNSEDHEIEQMHDSIEKLLGIAQDNDNVIIMGDSNAVVMEGKQANMA